MGFVRARLMGERVRSSALYCTVLRSASPFKVPSTLAGEQADVFERH